MKNIRETVAYFSIFATIAFLLCSCNKSEEGATFTVKGKIANAEEKNISVYYIGDNGIKEISSKMLDKNGDFEFRIASPEHFDFYMLNVEECGAIAFIADSTEVITINGDSESFIEEYTIDGNSENKHIKEIVLLRNALEKQVTEMANSTSPAITKTEREIRALVDEFKENIIKQYIIPAPGSASAYFALTLTIGNIPVFSPMTNREDSKYFAAVATNFQRLHPGTSHARNIKRIAEMGLNATRKPKTIELEAKESEALTTGIFDIKLPTANGDSIALSSQTGNVVLLDFTVYDNNELSSRNIKLRELYDKYRKHGFRIFQVSFDRREHFWQQSAANLPWSCVRDAGGSTAVLYNVMELPTFFLISRKGEVLLRDVQIENLEKEIEELLW